MRKLLNLYRLNFRNAVKMPGHWLKHTFNVGFSPEESTLNEYYVQLIVNDGFLKSENESSFSSFFPKWNAQIKTRKQPADDLAIFRKVFSLEEYKPLVDAFSDYFPHAKKLDIIDAGSHVGLLSVYLSRFFPDARFICVEKDQGNFETLGFNLRENVARSEKINGSLQTHPVKSIMGQFGLKKIDILKMAINRLESDTFAGDLSFLEVTKCVAFTIADESGREIICGELEKFGFTHFGTGKLTICINQKLV